MLSISTLLRTAVLSLAVAASAAPVQEDSIYHDEENRRYVTLSKADFGNTRVEVRFAGDPGSMSVWVGQGQRKDKDLLFARTVGEGEDQGTFFIAKISESKIEIAYKPQQKAPQDAGINGTYRRVSAGKLLQMLKKEAQAADERLQASVKAAGSQTWDRRDRPALDLWKAQWPGLKQRWLALAIPAPTPPPTSPRAGTPPANAEKTAAEWLKQAQITAKAYYFIEALPDAKTGTGWDGEYDDLAGGHVSLRQGKDGRLRVTLSSTRIEGEEGTSVEATVKPEQLSQGKNGEIVAEFVLTDPEIKEPVSPAKIKMVKIGRYLQITAENAQRHSPRGWFDGIYRGSPVPDAQ